MKKIKLLGLIAIASIVMLNVMIVGNSNGSVFTLTSLVNNALAQDDSEIDEVTVTCDSGGEGVCYEENVDGATPAGKTNANGEVKYKMFTYKEIDYTYTNN